jgi:hypothetical protein
MDDFPYLDFEGVREAAYGMEIPQEAAAAVTRLIDKAGERLAARVPRIPARVADGVLTKALVRGVVEDMVIRVIRNPYGYAQEQAGEFMYRIDRAVASGAVQVTDEDVQTLTGDGGGGSFGRVTMGIPAWRLP